MINTFFSDSFFLYMSALWDTRKLSTQSSSILIKHVTVSKKKSKKRMEAESWKSINQCFFPFLSLYSISIICFSRFSTARIRILFSLSSSLLHMRVRIRTRISNLFLKKGAHFLTFRIQIPRTQIRIKIWIKKDHWTGIQKKDADPQPRSAFFFSLSIAFFLGMGILIRTWTSISTKKNGKE